MRNPALLLPAALLVFSGCAAPRAAPAARDSGALDQARAATAPRHLTLGYSHGGAPIVMSVHEPRGGARRTTPAAPHDREGGRVLIIGGIHGNEPSSAHVAQRLAELLAREPELLAGCSVAVLASANPDGLAQRTRGNARGVDLNRNFPARNWRKSRTNGSRPGSEPETQAIMEALRAMRPHAVISIHAIHGPRQCNNYDGPALGLAQLMQRYNGYPVTPSLGYPTPGSLGSWLGVDRGVPIVTLELPRKADGERCWRENREALLALIRDVGGGPGVAGRARVGAASVRAR